MEELERLRSALSDRYQVEKEIGHGGMATVYLARDLKHDRHVAIKVLRSDLASMVGPDRFLREIQIEAGLQHINILPIHDSGKSDGFLYYVMPYVEGESLRARIEREGQLPLDDALHITHEVAEALSYAHDRGIVHRDIKPENILLSEGHAVLADFGIARAIGVAGGERVTESGHFVGTPQYLSPEQASGSSDLDGRSDLYSLGCVLYEMLVGEPPFTGRTAHAVIARHLADTPPSLRIVRPSVPAAIGEAIEKALSKTPADRFPTASDFVTTLETPVEPGPPVPRPLGFLQELWKRLVLHVGLAYLAFGWLAIGFTRTLVEHEVVGRWVTPILVVLLAVGLPLVLIAAWTREQEQPAARAISWPRWVERAHPGHMLAVLTVLVLGLLAGRYQLERYFESAPVIRAGAGLDPTSIAVLYFEDHSEGGQYGHLAAGFTNALITQLTQVDALTVRSFNTVKRYRDADVGADSIARALNVGTLVEGSFLVSESRVRVSIGLVNGFDGAQLQSQDLERPLGDIFALMDDVSQEVDRFLRHHLGEEIRLAEWRAGTESFAAWQLVKRAEELSESTEPLVMTGDTTTALTAFERADSLLARAEALDPSWVEPIIERGWVAADQARLFRVSRVYDPEYTRRGIAHADRALELDSTHPGALELRGTLRRYLWEGADSGEAAELREGAETDLRAAVGLDPSRARAWGSLSTILRVTGRFDEAKVAAERAYQTDAFLAEDRIVIFALCHSSLELEEFDDVVRWCGEGRRRFPERPSFVTLELLALAGSDGPEPDPDQAWLLARKFEELSAPQNRSAARITGLMRVAAVLARSGLADSAEAVITQAHAVAEPNPMTDYYEANARLQLGQQDRAIDLLQRYLEARPDRKAYLAEDWWFRPLRDDPRFQALVGGAQ